MAKHQYAAVLDLNKCIGCHTCTVACKKQWTDGDGMGYMYWNNVESQPGQGYPRGWHTMGGGFDARRALRPSAVPPLEDYGEALDYDYSQRLFGGKDKPVMPHAGPSWACNWEEDVGAGEGADAYFHYLPRLCNHCTHPACAEACPRKAIYKREEDGIVVIDQERCRGYRHCIRACPYKKIYYNAVTRTSQKCIFCYPRLEQGRTNACMAQCPGRLRFVGLLDDEDSPVHKLVKVYKVALPLFPDRGTHPNLFYVPPLAPPRIGRPDDRAAEQPRIPMDWLEYLFGPAVRDVIAFLDEELRQAQETGARSEVFQLLIGRNADIRFKIVPKTIAAAAPPDGARVAAPGGPALSPPGQASTETTSEKG